MPAPPAAAASNSRLAVTSLSPHLGPDQVQAVRELAQSSCMRSMSSRVALHLSQTSKCAAPQLYLLAASCIRARVCALLLATGILDSALDPALDPALDCTR
jgi:hypothetical protein